MFRLHNAIRSLDPMAAWLSTDNRKPTIPSATTASDEIENTDRTAGHGTRNSPGRAKSNSIFPDAVPPCSDKDSGDPFLIRQMQCSESELDQRFLLQPNQSKEQTEESYRVRAQQVPEDFKASGILRQSTMENGAPHDMPSKSAALDLPKQNISRNRYAGSDDIGVPAPKTYAEATNLAEHFPELASKILTLPLDRQLVPGHLPPENDMAAKVVAESTTIINGPPQVHTAERPNWALAPSEPAVSDLQGRRMHCDRNDRRRKSLQNENIRPKGSELDNARNKPSDGEGKAPKRRRGDTNGRSRRGFQGARNHPLEISKKEIRVQDLLDVHLPGDIIDAMGHAKEGDSICQERTGNKQKNGVKMSIHAPHWVKASCSDVDIPRLINPHSPMPPFDTDRMSSQTPPSINRWEERSCHPIESNDTLIQNIVSPTSAQDKPSDLIVSNPHQAMQVPAMRGALQPMDSHSECMKIPDTVQKRADRSFLATSSKSHESQTLAETTTNNASCGNQGTSKSYEDSGCKIGCHETKVVETVDDDKILSWRTPERLNSHREHLPNFCYARSTNPTPGDNWKDEWLDFVASRESKSEEPKFFRRGSQRAPALESFAERNNKVVINDCSSTPSSEANLQSKVATECTYAKPAYRGQNVSTSPIEGQRKHCDGPGTRPTYHGGENQVVGSKCGPSKKKTDGICEDGWMTF